MNITKIKFNSLSHHSIYIHKFNISIKKYFHKKWNEIYTNTFYKSIYRIHKWSALWINFSIYFNFLYMKWIVVINPIQIIDLNFDIWYISKKMYQLDEVVNAKGGKKRFKLIVVHFLCRRYCVRQKLLKGLFESLHFAKFEDLFWVSGYDRFARTIGV